MKQLTSLFFLFCCTFIFAQSTELSQKVTELKSKIAISEKAEKLAWMDSLTLLVEFNEAFGYEAIINQNIAHALAIDSLSTATRHTADILFYKSSILGLSAEGLTVFNAFVAKHPQLLEDRNTVNLYLYAGDCYYGLGDLEAAMESFQKAKQVATLIGDKNRIALVMQRMAYANIEIGKLAEASTDLQASFNIFSEINDTISMVNSKNGLANLYSHSGFYAEASAERQEALRLIENIGGGALTSLYYNEAADHRLQGNNKEWIRYLNLAREVNEKSEYRQALLPNILSNLVIAHALNDSLSKAESYFSEVKAIPSITTDYRTFYVEALKQLSFAKENYKEALQYGTEHLALKRAEDGFVEIYNAEKFLADVYAAMGNSNKKNYHLSNYYAIKDSISNVQNVRNLAYYQTLYETEKRDNKIAAQQSNIALLDQKNKIKNQLLLLGGIGLLVVFVSIILWRSRNAAKRRVLMQEQFSQDLINAQEDERIRVARELHDSVGQKLMLLSKKTRGMGDASVDSLADGTLAELRNISRGLHPSILEDLGLTAAIESMVNEVDANTSIFFTNDIENIDNALSKESSLHLYRIIQEVLNNMVKHANAKVASVVIDRREHTIVTEIKDNGSGFDIAIGKGTRSLGMKTLRERAKILKSNLQIKSDINAGTIIRLDIPL